MKLNTKKTKGEKTGYCQWHKSRLNVKERVLVGEMRSLTGKWFPACRMCWNRRSQLLERNPYAGMFNLERKNY